MNRLLANAMVVIPPLVIAGLLVGVLMWAAAWRRSWGASAGTTAGAIGFAALVLVVHAGYFAAPFLYNAGRAGLGLWLTGPVAALAVVLLGVYLLCASSGALIPEHATERALRAAVCLGVPLVYWSPVLVFWRMK